MDLLEYSDRVAGKPSLQNLQSLAPRLWDEAYRIIGNESRTDPTVAAVLSQIVLLTDEFSSVLQQRHLNPKKHSQREVILLNRSNWGEYALLIADDRFHGQRFAGSETLRLSTASVQQALRRWRNAMDRRLYPSQSRVRLRHLLRRWMKPLNRRSEDDERLFDAYRKLSSVDLRGLDQFTVYFVQRPRLIRTGAPIPAWEVTAAGINSRATAGCIVQHVDGRRSGVTSVRHFFPGSHVAGTSVDVDGSPGVVAGDDLMSDSVFIHLPSFQSPAGRRGVKGWLKGVAPRQGEIAMFEGATSHTTKTAVMGQDPGLTRYSPYRQARVYTPAVTNPGDSGAALIEESTDLIIGFAMERTEAGAPIEWSSWIWADSVFTALDVSPL